MNIEVVRAEALRPGQYAEIVALCQRAYGEDLTCLFATLTGGIHVLGYQDGALASHAMWVRRELQPGDGPALRSAYVEMVATEPGRQGQGLASAVMRRLANEIAEYELGALCPAETGIYARLSWEFWRGPLFIRERTGLLATPEERVMVLRLPRTPALDLDQPLTAEWREGELW